VKNHCLSIGGVAFQVISRDVKVEMKAHASYALFLTPGKCRSPHVTVRLHTEAAVSPDGMEKIFDSDQTWSLYRQGERMLILSYAPAEGDTYRWAAEIRWDRRTVDLFCGAACVREDGGQRAVVSPLCYPLDQILLMLFLAGEGLVLHAAGAIVGGKGLVFPGVSGAGKSTVTRLLARDERFRPLSDDRVVVREGEGEMRVYGTPWPGDAEVAENAEGPLAAILFLVKAEESAVRPLDGSEALRRLLPVASVPWFDRERTEASLSLCEKILGAVPAFELRFHPDSPVADMVGDFASSL
jgi:hypothetical protein